MSCWGGCPRLRTEARLEGLALGHKVLFLSCHIGCEVGAFPSLKAFALLEVGSCSLKFLLPKRRGTSCRLLKVEQPAYDFSPGCKGEPDGASEALILCCG